MAKLTDLKNWSFSKPVKALVLILILGGAFWLGGQVLSDDKTNNQNDIPAAEVRKHQSVEIGHPSQWQAVLLNDREKQSGVLARYDRHKPDGTLIITQSLADSSKEDDHGSEVNLNQAANEIIQKLKAEIEGFRLTKKTIDQKQQPPMIELSYKVANQKEVTQSIIILNDRAYYLTYTTVGGFMTKITNDIKAINAEFIKYIKDKKLD